MAIRQTMTAGTWAVLILLSLLWGASFFFFKVLLSELPTFTIVFLRVWIAAVAMLVFARVTGKEVARSSSAWKGFFVMAALNNVIPFSLIIWGETQITSGLAAILNATTPIFTVLVAHVQTHDERLSTQRVIGVVLGFAGVVMLIGLGAVHTFSLSSLAQIAVVAAAIFYAVAIVYGRRFPNMGIDPVGLSMGQLCASAVLSLPLSLLVDRPWTFHHFPSPHVIAAILALAILSTAVAYILYFRVLQVSGATNASLVTFLIPITALVWGSVLLREHISALDIAGMLVIFAGLATIDGRILRWIVGQRLVRGA